MIRETTVSRSAVADCAGIPCPVLLISYSASIVCFRSRT